ncbi:MAG: pantoate--beta-alanine ligase [Mariprofundales bacterium]
MILLHDIISLRTQVSKWHKLLVALVPTMGCLHEGHMSLVDIAKQKADIVIVSLFINPLQFGAGEDYAAYPRPLATDISICKSHNVDAMFVPEELGQPQTIVKAGKMADCLCGQSRLGHFDGVLTIVSILLHLVQPDIAVFGEKDFQQLQLIRKMTHDLHMPVQILEAPLLRDNDGLALSSRNRYLSDSEKKQALALSQSLLAMHSLAQQKNNSISAILSAGFAVLATYNVRAQYLEIRDENLQLAEHIQDGCRAFIAANIGGARLIDNMPLK